MKRRSNPHNLPPGMHIKHGAFYRVRKNVWTRLGSLDERTEAFEEYARLTGPKRVGGMVDLIHRVFKMVSTTPSAKTGEMLAANTVQSYEQARDRLLKVFAEFDPQQIRSKHIVALRNGDAAKPGAARRNQIFLKIVLDVAVEEELIEYNPAIGVRKAKTKSRKRYINDAEFVSIYQIAGPRLKVIMKLCYLTAQRIGNVLRIRFEDLGEEGITFGKHKTSQPLIVKWNPSLREAVEEAKALLVSGNISLIQKGPLLRGERAGKRHRAPAYDTIREQWDKACEAAKVENATLHDLRAKGATDAQKQGFDPQALLDHADKRTTDIYLRDPEMPRVQGPGFRQALDT